MCFRQTVLCYGMKGRSGFGVLRPNIQNTRSRSPKVASHNAIALWKRPGTDPPRPLDRGARESYVHERCALTTHRRLLCSRGFSMPADDGPLPQIHPVRVVTPGQGVVSGPFRRNSFASRNQAGGVVKTGGHRYGENL